MRILVSIIGFLLGCGLVAYSYLDGFVALGAKAEASDPVSFLNEVIAMFLNIAETGEVARAPEYLYFGLLVIAVSIVNLFGKNLFGEKKSDER